MAKKPNKENTMMICNGGMAPQVAQVMEAYQSYMNGVYYFYQAWAAMTGMSYLSDQVKAYYQHDVEGKQDE